MTGLDNIEFLDDLRKNAYPNPEHNLFMDIWSEYERVILHSLITSFGLDFLVKDRFGGDVDTVHNVLTTGEFKNPRYLREYENRGKYNPADYHSHDIYRNIVSTNRKDFNSSGIPIEDAYVPGNRLFFSSARAVGPWRRAALDHVISAHEIHDDPVRILSDKSGVDLANDPENLRFTSISLNSKMKDKPIEDFIEWCDQNPDKVNWNGNHGESLPDEVRDNLVAEDKRARTHYIATIEKDYYSSSQFYKDATIAACKRGIEMGARQALGFVLLEVWMSCKKELQDLAPGSDMDTCFIAITKGIQHGLINVKQKYKVLINTIEEGFGAGVIASITTTLVNVFVTTKVEQVKYIRWGCTAVVQAGNTLLINPEDLLIGDLIKQTIVILGSGASTIAGGMVGDKVAQSPIGKIKIVGESLVKFSSVLVSGLLSCTLLILLDRSKLMNYVVRNMNQYSTIDRNIKDLSNQLYVISAQYERINTSKFISECNVYSNLATSICRNAQSADLSALIETAIISLSENLPWTGDFNDFMADDQNTLDFGCEE